MSEEKENRNHSVRSLYLYSLFTYRIYRRPHYTTFFNARRASLNYASFIVFRRGFCILRIRSVILPFFPRIILVLSLPE